MNLVIWLDFVWLFGLILFGYLDRFCLVIWTDFVWLFGPILFGYLASEGVGEHQVEAHLVAVDYGGADTPVYGVGEVHHVLVG